MAIMAKGGNGGGQQFEYEPTPAGTYQAVVYNVFDLGNQQEEFKGKVKIRHKVSIGFELVGLTYKTGDYAGKPMTKYRDYSTTLFEDKGLGGLIPILIGRPLTDAEVKNGFDLEQLIGKNCLVTVIQKVSATGKTYARIANIGGLVQGMTAVAPTISRDHVPLFIQELQAKALPDGSVATAAPAQEAPKVMTKAEMQWQIQDWINQGKVKQTDVQATVRAVGKQRAWKDLTLAEAQTVFLRVEKLAKPDITEGTGFDATPVTPPAF